MRSGPTHARDFEDEVAEDVVACVAEQDGCSPICCLLQDRLAPPGGSSPGRPPSTLTDRALDGDLDSIERYYKPPISSREQGLPMI